MFLSVQLLLYSARMSVFQLARGAALEAVAARELPAHASQTLSQPALQPPHGRQQPTRQYR